MFADAIRQFLNRMPFQPFRLFVLDMTAFDVRHPEMVILGRSVLMLTVPNPAAPPSLPERRVTIALLHISRIEPLPAASSSIGNGQ